MTVTFGPLSDDDFGEFLIRLTESYAQDMVLADDLKLDDAREKASTDLEKLLPQGSTTPDHSLRSLVNGAGEIIGMIWYGPETSPTGHPVTFIYNFYVGPEFRRRGYGTAALDTLCVEVTKTAATAVWLHVFAHNTAAIALYERTGFTVEDARPGNVLMRKVL